MGMSLTRPTVSVAILEETLRENSIIQWAWPCSSDAISKGKKRNKEEEEKEEEEEEITFINFKMIIL